MSTLLPGSRTLLRLHRALEFITLFLRQIQNSADDTKLGDIGSTAYLLTLSKHHTWIIRKGVGLALYILPTKAQLMERLSDQHVPVMNEEFGQVVDSIQPVYDIVQKLYMDSNILNLP